MSILLPALLWFGSGGSFTFGGAKPVPVNSAKFRNYRRGDIIVSAAGVVTNLILAARLGSCCSSLVGLIGQSLPAAAPVVDTAQRMMVYGIWLNLFLCFFNLIPIPPLDGSHLFYHLLPPRGGQLVSRAAAVRLSAPIRADVSVPAGDRLSADARPTGMMLLFELICPFAVGDGWNIFQS